MENNEELEIRLKTIESRIEKLEGAALAKKEFAASAISQPQVTERISDPAGTQTVPPNNQQNIQVEEEEEYETDEPSQFIEWIKTDWLMKLGGLLIIIALGWFVTYAFMNNWIGPVGRIALGIMAGVCFMGVGHWQIPKRKAAGQFLVVLGGIMTLLTLFAARMIYESMLTKEVAMGMMCLVVIGMAVIAILRNTKSIAYLALIGGAAVPLMINSGSNDLVALLSYIFILDIGVLIVTAMKGWRGLTLTALIISGLYTFAFHDMSQGTIWIFMTLFYGLFFAASASAILHSKKALISDLFTTGISGLLLLYWIYEFVPKEWASILLSGLILMMIGIGYLLKRIGNLAQPLSIYLALAVVFLGTATVFELDGAWVTIAFTLEALALTVLSSYLLDVKKAREVSALQVLPALMSFGSMSSYKWGKATTLFHEDFFVLLVLALSLIGTAIYFKKTITEESESRLISRIHYTATIVISIILVWLSTQTIFDSDNIARGASLVIYALGGVSFVYYGAREASRYHSAIGGIILGGVVLRLLFVEVWAMPLSGRIITFVAIGILLIITAFFKKRLIK